MLLVNLQSYLFKNYSHKENFPHPEGYGYTVVDERCISVRYTKASLPEKCGYKVLITEDENNIVSDSEDEDEEDIDDNEY